MRHSHIGTYSEPITLACRRLELFTEPNEIPSASWIKLDKRGSFSLIKSQCAGIQDGPSRLMQKATNSESVTMSKRSMARYVHLNLSDPIC
jgi:hypothetical protein